MERYWLWLHTRRGLSANGLRQALAAFETPAGIYAASGAALFVVSDMTLCYNTVQKKPTLWHYISLGIYYTAQLLLGLSAGKPF